MAAFFIAKCPEVQARHVQISSSALQADLHKAFRPSAKTQLHRETPQPRRLTTRIASSSRLLACSFCMIRLT
jgi:hypothetical protein